MNGISDDFGSAGLRKRSQIQEKKKKKRRKLLHPGIAAFETLRTHATIERELVLLPSFLFVSGRLILR